MNSAEFLRAFHRGCDHRLSVSRAKLELFFTVRGLLPAWFQGWDTAEPGVAAVIRAGVTEYIEQNRVLNL